MDMVFVIGLAVVLLIVIGVIRARGRPRSHQPPRVVTRNLDYTILGQRPEIITEDDADLQETDAPGKDGE